MFPEDASSLDAPALLQRCVEESILSPLQMGAVLEHLPVAEGFGILLGSEEGLDSTRWPVEHDFTLAERAAQSLSAELPALRQALLVIKRCGRDGAALREARDDWLRGMQSLAGGEAPPAEELAGIALALDLFAVRAQSLEGLFAYHVHRRLRPCADAVARLLRAALDHGALRPDTLLAEMVALARQGASGGQPNDVYAETRGAPRLHAGGEPHFARPDFAVLVIGEADEGHRIDLQDTLRHAVAKPERTAPLTLTGAFESCPSLLGPEAEIAGIWLHGAMGHAFFSGSRGRLLRSRQGRLEEILSVTESGLTRKNLFVREVDVCEGDMYLLLDDPSFARAALDGSIARLQNVPAMPVDFAAVPLPAIAKALFDCAPPGERSAAILRVPPYQPPPDLHERLAALLERHARDDGVAVRLGSVTVTNRGDGHPLSGALRHLEISLICDPLANRERAEESAKRFASALCARHPRLCSSHAVRFVSDDIK